MNSIQCIFPCFSHSFSFFFPNAQLAVSFGAQSASRLLKLPSNVHTHTFGNCQSKSCIHFVPFPSFTIHTTFIYLSLTLFFHAHPKIQTLPDGWICVQDPETGVPYYIGPKHAQWQPPCKLLYPPIKDESVFVSQPDSALLEKEISYQLFQEIYEEIKNSIKNIVICVNV